MADLRHILILCDIGFVNGGEAKVAIDSAIGLAERGFEVSYLAACGPMDPDLERSGVRTICLDQAGIAREPSRFKAARSAIWNRAAATAVREEIGRLDPAKSIVHWHGFVKALSPSVGPVLARSPVPHVYTMHDFSLACPNGGFYDFQQGEPCFRVPLGAACLTTHCDVRKASHKAFRVARLGVAGTFGKLPRALRNIIYISEIQHRAIAPHLPSSARLFHVPNPVGVVRSPRVAVEENSMVLAVGRLSPEKGCVMLARAAGLAGVQVVFVGEGGERASILAANPEAVITGWLPAADVQQWLRRSRCLAFPSLWYETFGLSAYEALAMGVPVVAGAWNAAADGVVPDETGFTFEVRDQEVLARTLAGMTPEAARRLSVTAYERYWANPFTIERHVDALVQVYEAGRETRGAATS